MPSPIVTSIRKSLKASSSEKTRKTSETFFKEKAKFHGAPSAAYRKIGREHFAQVKKLDKREILFLCEELLQSGYVEEAIIAYEWADRLRSRSEERRVGKECR